MKTAIKFSIITVMVSGFIHADEMKRYEVKSAKIEYELKGSGDMMGGMVKIKSIGKKRLIFDNYGLKELTEENKVSKNTTMGTTKVDKTHTLKYMNGSIIYGVRFKEKRITRMKSPMAGMGSLFGGKSATETGEAMLKKMGGKKIGTDKVAGHTCDVWDLSGVKQCLYKGIPLKVESNIMGLKTVEIATKAEFDLSLDKNDFKLPDFPVYNMDMDNPQQQSKPMDKSKLEAMDKRENTKIGKQEKEGQEAMVNYLQIMKEAYASVGLKLNEKPTKEQQKAIELYSKKAAMKSMGGEKAIFEREKREILEDFANVPKAKECFENASSAKDANACERMIDSEDPEEHYKWNNTIQSKILKRVEDIEKSIPCVKKASSFDAIEKCFPEE